MRCSADYFWCYENGQLLTTLFGFILLCVIIYASIRFIYKYKNGYNYKAIHQNTCPNCDIPVEATYIRCPECHYKLKTNCPSCGMVVKTDWDVCPYCEKELLVNKNG